MMKRITAVMALIAAAVQSAPVAAHGETGADRAAEASQQLEALVNRDGGSGAMAAVVRDGVLVWHGEAGYADIEAGIAMAHDHRLRIGSVSKFVSAALALRLHDAGLFDVDAPIADFLPDMPEHYASVTSRDLARHLAGMRHHDFGNFAEANNQLYYRDLYTPLAPILEEPLQSMPGERFEYSSFGFNLIGAAMEAHLGMRFDDLVQQHLAEPLALDNVLANDAMTLIERRAHFYTVTASNPVFPWMTDGALIPTIYRDDSDLYPSGGMLSNAVDLAILGHAVLAGTHLSDASRQRLVAPTVLQGGEPARIGRDGYGFGTLIYRRDGRVWGYGHGGLTNGGMAELIHLPDQRMTIAIIVNYNSMGASGFESFARDTLPQIFAEPWLRN